MAWDADRPIPWKRLLVPFGVYAGIAVVTFSVFGQANFASLVTGVLGGGLIYLGVAVVLVKSGWNPPQFGARQPRASSGGSTSSTTTSTKAAPTTGPRPKPQPTGRTNAGNPKAKRSR
jgi:hypothetical protein